MKSLFVLVMGLVLFSFQNEASAIAVGGGGGGPITSSERFFMNAHREINRLADAMYECDEVNYSGTSYVDHAYANGYSIVTMYFTSDEDVFYQYAYQVKIAWANCTKETGAGSCDYTLVYGRSFMTDRPFSDVLKKIFGKDISKFY